MNRFLNKCAVQLDLLYASTNKILYFLVLEQLTILRIAKLPYFTAEVCEQFRDCGGVYNASLCAAMEKLRRVAAGLLSLRIKPYLHAPSHHIPQSAQFPRSESVMPSKPYASTSAPALLPPPAHLARQLSDGKKKKRRKMSSDELNRYGPAPQQMHLPLHSEHSKYGPGVGDASYGRTPVFPPIAPSSHTNRYGSGGGPDPITGLYFAGAVSGLKVAQGLFDSPPVSSTSATRPSNISGSSSVVAPQSVPEMAPGGTKLTKAELLRELALKLKSAKKPAA